MVCGSMDKCAFIFLILTSDGTKVGDFFEVRELKGQKTKLYVIPIQLIHV